MHHQRSHSAAHHEGLVFLRGGIAVKVCFLQRVSRPSDPSSQNLTPPPFPSLSRLSCRLLLGVLWCSMHCRKARGSSLLLLFALSSCFIRGTSSFWVWPNAFKPSVRCTPFQPPPALMKFLVVS